MASATQRVMEMRKASGSGGVSEPTLEYTGEPLRTTALGDHNLSRESDGTPWFMYCIFGIAGAVLVAAILYFMKPALVYDETTGKYDWIYIGIGAAIGAALSVILKIFVF